MFGMLSCYTDSVHVLVIYYMISIKYMFLVLLIKLYRLRKCFGMLSCYTDLVHVLVI